MPAKLPTKVTVNLPLEPVTLTLAVPIVPVPVIAGKPRNRVLHIRGTGVEGDRALATPALLSVKVPPVGEPLIVMVWTVLTAAPLAALSSTTGCEAKLSTMRWLIAVGDGREDGEAAVLGVEVAAVVGQVEEELAGGAVGVGADFGHGDRAARR